MYVALEQTKKRSEATFKHIPCEKDSFLLFYTFIYNFSLYIV